MSSSRDSCAGTLSFFGFEDTSAQVDIERHPHADRVKRALVTLAKFWGIGALCVLIPIAHFGLVPTFFVLGIVLALRKLGENATIVGVTGVCPRCKATGPFEVSGLLKSPAKVQCRTCNNELRLTIDPMFLKS
jgi:hypothetical protein